MDPWKFVENTIEVVTRGSYKLMDILLRDHVARLTKQLVKTPADVDYQEMLGAASSELSAWSSEYLSWRLARGVYKGRTQTFYELLESLPDRLDDWDIDIQAAGGPTRPYKAGKAAYTVLFTSGREPFTTGAVDQRVAAVETLTAALTAQAPLAAVAASVGAFYTELANARTLQQQEEGGTETGSTTLEARRLSAAEAMYRNIGRLMTKHGASRLIEKFYDMSYIRDGATPPPEGTPAAPGNFTVAPVSGQPSTALTTWSAVAEVLGYRLWRRLPGETAWSQAGETTDLSLALTDQPTGVEIELAVSAFNAEGNGARSAPETITL